MLKPLCLYQMQLVLTEFHTSGSRVIWNFLFVMKLHNTEISDNSTDNKDNTIYWPNRYINWEPSVQDSIQFGMKCPKEHMGKLLSSKAICSLTTVRHNQPAPPAAAPGPSVSRIRFILRQTQILVKVSKGFSFSWISLPNPECCFPFQTADLYLATKGPAWNVWFTS